jgi:predicted NAD/FAD-dependent oxidoreductase
MYDPDANRPIAIIGAGLAGLSAALSLTARRRSVRLFDKGRGPGGRLSTRRIDGWQFDHGGQYLTVRDTGLRAAMDGLLAGGHAARWDGRVVRLGVDGGLEPHPVERFVGVPGMNGIIRGLVAGVPDAARPQYGRRAMAVEGEPGHWVLRMDDGVWEGPFAALVMAIPAPQAAALLTGIAPSLAGRAAEAEMAPCWALMLGFAEVATPRWDAAFVAGAGGDDRPLSWIAHDGAKPGRAGKASFVAHAAPGWSARHLDETGDAVVAALLPAFRGATGIDADPVLISAHRWRYALPTRPLTDGFLWDADLGIGACGDWCLEARAEAAFVSGARLAKAMAG